MDDAGGNRAAWQSSTADPSLPVGAAICFSVWRLFDKRKKRDPEGFDSGRSPIWAALGVTLFGLIAGSLVSVPLTLSSSLLRSSHHVRRPWHDSLWPNSRTHRQVLLII